MPLQDGWWVYGVYFIVDGEPILAELRIIPADGREEDEYVHDLGEWNQSETALDSVTAPITSRMLRDLSLVGPRPWPPEMVRRQVAEGLDYRNRILAGLTGPAQVTKGQGIPYEDLDSQYLERCSTLSGWSLVRYDLQILWRTLVVMARGEGLNY